MRRFNTSHRIPLGLSGASKMSKTAPIRSRAGSLYLEHGRLQQQEFALVFETAKQSVTVPARQLALLELGPGVTVTSAAMKLLAECGCTVCWTGQNGHRLYAAGQFGTSGRRLLRQARMFFEPAEREAVMRRLLRKRIGQSLPPGVSESVLRGIEGKWMRDLYARLARQTDVSWEGRILEWEQADAVNRALSVGHGCLYGLCHCAILAAGCSPAIGFLHTGNQRSFVFDVADLYKPETTVPTAFAVAREGEEDVASRTRRACREAFARARLLERLIPDILEVLDDRDDPEEAQSEAEG